MSGHALGAESAVIGGAHVVNVQRADAKIDPKPHVIRNIVVGVIRDDWGTCNVKGVLAVLLIGRRR